MSVNRYGYQRFKETCERLFGKTEYRNMSDLEFLTLDQLKERYKLATDWIDNQSKKEEEDRSKDYEHQLKRFKRIQELIEEKEMENALL